MLDICLLGTGGMMPLPYRRLTSMMARINGSNILVDCGEGTQVSIKAKGWSVHPIDVICFTHYHADHISGLPGLLLSIGNAERTEPVLMIGPKGLERVVNSLRVIAPELPFKIKFHELRETEEDIPMDGYNIHAFRVNHNVTCYGYSLTVPRQGRFDVDRANAAGIPMRLWNPLQKGESVEFEGKTYTPDMVLGPERKGIKVTYTTDTRPTDLIAENAKGSDVFICEGMYGEKDCEEKARNYKHMTFREAARLARRANPGELWLTHYSPSLTHPEQYMDDVRKIFPRAKAGKDGMSTVLTFKED